MESNAVGARNLDTTSQHAHCFHLHIHLLNQRPKLKLLRCHHLSLKHKLRLKPVSHRYLRLKLLSHKFLRVKLLRFRLLRLKLLRANLLRSKMHQLGRERLRLQLLSHKFLTVKLLRFRLLRLKLLRAKLLRSKMHQLGRERLRLQLLSHKLPRFHQLKNKMLQLTREGLVVKFLLLNENKLQSQETKGERREDMLLSQCSIRQFRMSFFWISDIKSYCCNYCY
jgi:hypothetical protein